MDAAAYFATIFPESGEPVLKTFTSLDGLVAFAKTVPETAQGYFFSGHKLEVTIGPWRYLITETGETIPLFEAPKPGRVDKSASLGHNAKASGLDNDYLTAIRRIPEEEFHKTHLAEDEFAAEDDADGESEDEEVLEDDSSE